MSCEIYPGIDLCDSEIASPAGKLLNRLSELDFLDSAFGFVQTARREKRKKYPRFAYIENDKPKVIDLFPSNHVSESYSFLEYLGEAQINSDNLISQPTGLIFLLRGKQESEIDGYINQAAQLLTFSSAINSISLERRIENVWSLYGYTIEDFGQFQQPMFSFKFTFNLVSPIQFCCP